MTNKTDTANWKLLLPAAVLILAVSACGNQPQDATPSPTPSSTGTVTPSATLSASPTGWSEEACRTTSQADWVANCRQYGASATSFQPMESTSHTAKYGTPTVIDTKSGQVEITVGVPEVVTYHAAEYDPKSPTSTKPGKAFPPMVRIKVSAKGVTGSVSIKALDTMAWQYEAPDGTLESESFPPLMAYETTDPTSNHPTTLGLGQKTAGEIFFQSPSPDGKVIIKVMGDRITDEPTPWTFTH